MALTASYVTPTARIPDFFGKIRDGQAPDRLSQQLLKDWGFTSSNDQAFIPLLKTLGFLSSEGVPTQRYHNYRDHSKSRRVLGEAIKEAYGDIFLIKANPSSADRAAIEGKFKSFHNASENVASIMYKTFAGLLALADISPTDEYKVTTEKVEPPNFVDSAPKVVKTTITPSLNYNIQIHLPATKDIEVYNSIFKSLKEHLLVE